MISTSDTLTVGKTSQLNCTIYDVYPAPIIEWFLGPGEENITMNASIHSNPDNISSLFNATSSLLFTPTTDNHGENLTCRVSPSVPNVWKSRNASVTLNIEGDLSPSDEIRVENVTSSSLTLSWDVDNVTLEYCNCSYASSDILKTTDSLNCRVCNEPIRVNGTSYDLTGLEPFQWYNLTLNLTDEGVVASKLVSTAPPVPEYYGVIMTFSQENSKLKISRMLQLNDPIPSDLCFSVVKTQDQRDNCSLSNCLELGNKLRYINTSIEHVSDFWLVSSGRELCSSPPSSPIILNSTAGVLNMPPIILLGAVAGSAIFLFLTLTAIIFLINCIWTGVGCLRMKDDSKDEETLVRVIKKDNSRKVDKDGLVYVQVAHEKAHPTDAPPIRTEEPTVYASLDRDAMSSMRKKDADGLVYVEVSHDHAHPDGAPPIQTETPTVYANLDMEAMEKLQKDKKEKEEEEGRKVDEDSAKLDKNEGAEKDDVNQDGGAEEKREMEKEEDKKSPGVSTRQVKTQPNYENIDLTDFGDGLGIPMETKL
ncbi:uncharacterized protein LOC121420104 [Lytechinus variegatus]|uniref:uncharacterized protein LOC121420104 n=1 Tax=Lytechinus variegatus TaxID=7654 RepID=UPI001BB2522B|nr:uncharacterized protein LOC121420104 [Lytechinus variegatus]